ncbi:SoxR reducing system RseC family protein [Prevotella sp. OH937_COT-195]|uniref:SoxR reducing system RseC family protein n=1 Tax=Prevotella sp. OH937_COT-195 TaxID=2491051 RepID=UPI000F64FE28|nr:SoxR reducing system RseC family protein [Prevotella sp. OH937_COT-195]RRC97867.1 hypothetical protein EII32_10015 [Prevotella sp. OH937_COT-195]
MIEHSGIIDRIEHDCIKVRIVRSSACSSCNAAQLCNAAEKKEKIVDVYNFDTDIGYKQGDTVTVIATSRTGFNAVFFAFVIPFIILVGGIFLFSIFTNNEPSMALGGICSLIPYYILLYFLRHRLRDKLSFTIKDNNTRFSS